MRSFQLAVVALLITSFGIHSAAAFTVDQRTGTNNDGSTKFDDPDDKVPFPHMTDDGSQSSSNFQSQAVGNSGLSFGLSPSSGAQPDAFQRAQDRMQQ